MRRAMLVGSDKLAVYHWSKGCLGHSYLFDASTKGLEFFNRYLSDVRNSPVYMLLDISAEEYKLDTIPHVFGADRRALIARKQNRIFKGTPYFYAEVQGREQSGRRDDNILLTAITNPEVIQPWLKLLEIHQVPIASVTSVPLLLQEINHIIPDTQSNMLVFSLQSISGLRQSFFRDKSLKFSRLVKVPRYKTESYTPLITEELNKVLRYIKGAHLLDKNKPLDIYFLGNKALLYELGKTHKNTTITHYHMLDVDALSKTCGLIEPINTPFSDKYFIYKLLKHKSKNYYAVRKETQYFKIRQINKHLQIASLTLILFGIVWGGINMFEGFSYEHQQKIYAGKVAFYNARYAVAKQQIPVSSIEPTDLKIAVDAKNLLAKYKTDPTHIFKLISQSLNDFPEMQISRIQWVTNRDPNYKIGSAGLINNNEEGIQNVLDSNNKIDTESDYIFYQIAIFNAYLEDNNNNHRKTLKTIDEFSESMRKMESVLDVSVITLPLDISSQASLHGSAKGNNSESKFSIRVVLEGGR